MGTREQRTENFFVCILMRMLRAAIAYGEIE
jgi:hypothetical protein